MKHLSLFLFFVLICSNAASAEITKDKPKNLNPLSGLSSSKSPSESPLLIKSDTVRLDSVNNLFIYEGNVRAVRGDTIITAKRLTGKYSKENELKDVLCEQDVVITRGQDVRASSQRAFYNVGKSTIELTESPELINGNNALSADKITMFLDEDRSEAEGDVRVKVINEEVENELSPETQELLSD